MKQKHELKPENWIGEYRDYLVKFAWGKVSDLGIAEDLVQDTFLSAWAARKRFRGACSERTWLVGVLKNKIIDHYRRSSRRPLVMETDLLNPEREENGGRSTWLEQHALAGDKFDPARKVEQFEFMAELDAGIDSLPALSGQAFRMREVQGLSTDEITQALNITKSNLWVLIHRAKSGLRRHFDGELYQLGKRAAA